MLPGRPTARRRTSGWSSSATACSSSRSRASCTSAIRTSRKGRLAKIRSHVVSRASCAVVARQLDLGDRLAERGAEHPGRRAATASSRNRNVLAALLEAALGGALPRARLRADRAADRDGVLGPDRVRAHDPRRLQDGAAGGTRAAGAVGQLRRARRRGPAARPPLHVRGRDRRQAVRGRLGGVQEGGRAGGRQEALASSASSPVVG